MRGIITISLVTLRESLRSKIFAGLIIFLGLFLIFSVYVSTLALGDSARYIMNTGMLGLAFVCLAVSILFGLFSLYQEKERNELYVLLNRVKRSSYLLGRFLGTTYIIIIFSLAAGLGIFVLTWIFGDRIAPQLFWNCYWTVLEFTMITALGFMFYALNVGFTLNSLIVLGFFIVGHSMAEAVKSIIVLGRLGSPLHLYLVKAISIIFPNFDMFDFRLNIVHAEALPWGRVGLSTIYWVLYLTALLAAASAVMHKRDI